MTTWTSSVVVGLVDPRRQVRALSRELERNGVAIRAANVTWASTNSAAWIIC